MSLKITRLSVRDFRCYQGFDLEPDPELTVLVGPNAVGKTNLMEAAQLLTAGESFRRPQWAEVVRWGAEKALTSLHAEGEGRSLDVELTIEGSRRDYKVNGKAKRRLAEVIGVVPSVLFVPDDLRLTKESAERRRSALDGLGAQVSPAFLAAKNEYDRVLRQRNRLLKEQTSPADELEVWTERLVQVGVRFQEARERLFSRVLPHLVEAHGNVAGGAILSARYEPSYERDGQGSHGGVEESMRHHLKSKAKEEAARGVTLSGPHRDDVSFLLEGRDVRAYASQGQHRTIALAWKLAEVAVIEEIGGQTPLLLLDDVMSELDEGRRHALAAKAGRTAQTIMTTTNTGYFERDLIRRATVVQLG